MVEHHFHYINFSELQRFLLLRETYEDDNDVNGAIKFAKVNC